MCVPGSACHGSIHSHHVSFEITRPSSAAVQWPSSTCTSTLLMPRSGAQATPAIGVVPAWIEAPPFGTSMRDCVLMGASLDQPSGTQ